MTGFARRGPVPYVRQRTTVCPTCSASVGKPCTAFTDREVERALHNGRFTVRPHQARLTAEAALAATKES